MAQVPLSSGRLCCRPPVSDGAPGRWRVGTGVLQEGRLADLHPRPSTSRTTGEGKAEKGAEVWVWQRASGFPADLASLIQGVFRGALWGHLGSELSQMETADVRVRQAA